MTHKATTMIHFHGNPNCGSRGSRDITSTAEDLEEYSNLHRSDPWRYCSECLTPESIRTDSERYAELRKLVECWQKNLGQAHKDALIQWKHR